MKINRASARFKSLAFARGKRESQGFGTELLPASRCDGDEEISPGDVAGYFSLLRYEPSDGEGAA